MSATLHPLELPRRMAPTDALFWYAETALPIFRPIIGGLYLLDRLPDRARIERGCDAAVAYVPRLRQRVVEAPLQMGLPEYADDLHFDRAYHLRYLSVPRPGGRRELLELVAAIFATPLDRERPLWEAYCIEGLEGDRAAYFFKMHHSLVDGVGALALLEVLTQEGRDAPVPRVRRRPTRASGIAPMSEAGSLLGLARSQLGEGVRLAGHAAALPLHVLSHPTESIEQARRVARGFQGVLRDAMSPSVVDPLARDTSGLSRRLDIFDVSLERLREIAGRRDVTINDVVLTALAGTLGAYHRRRRAPVEILNCMVPMSLRAREEQAVLGNRVGMFNIALPVAERDPERRLQRIRAQTRVAKTDRRSGLYPFLVQALTLLPGAAFGWLARQSLGRINVACTNIPGVREPRYMAGARIEALYPFASVVEGTPVVMALLSYAGNMHIGLDTDPEAVPDPHAVSELFDHSLGELEGGRVRGSEGPRARRGERSGLVQG